MANFHYFYQSKENQNLEGWISAKSRDDVYAQLRKVGIKPYKVIGKNPLAWKRWAAIVVLAAALVIALSIIFFRSPVVPGSQSPVHRHQIYGAESVIRNGIATDWSACNLDEGERFLARYAQPGIPVALVRADLNKIASAIEKALENRLEPQDGELLEYRQIKQIVETMKSELRAYIAHGGTPRLYIDRLQERQSQEVAYYRAANQELETAKKTMSDDDLYALWAAKNSELRAIGLPMLKEPSVE
ncbi:MAG: hypothetical protein ACI4I0_05955 [Acutalibacteraceae bacterium]